MKVVKYLLKTLAWSVGIGIGIRMVFGLYSVFGPPVLLISLGLAIAASVSLSASSNAGFVTVSMLHMVLTTAAYIFFDYSGLFLTLASDTAKFFAGFSSDDVRVNILWCIMFVMPVYFFCFIVSSGIIASVKSRRLQEMTEDDDYYKIEDKVITHRK